MKSRWSWAQGKPKEMLKLSEFKGSHGVLNTVHQKKWHLIKLAEQDRQSFGLQQFIHPLMVF